MCGHLAIYQCVPLFDAGSTFTWTLLSNPSLSVIVSIGPIGTCNGSFSLTAFVVPSLLYNTPVSTWVTFLALGVVPTHAVEDAEHRSFCLRVCYLASSSQSKLPLGRSTSALIAASRTPDALWHPRIAGEGARRLVDHVSFTRGHRTSDQVDEPCSSQSTVLGRTCKHSLLVPK